MTLASIWRYTGCVTAMGGLAMATPCASTDSADQEFYRCNTPNGHYDGEGFQIVNTFTSISGKISLHAADIAPEWGSVGKILVHQHGAHFSDGDCGCNGIAVYAFKNPDHIEFNLTANGKDVPIAQSPYDTSISFRISISPEGVMTVAIGETKPVIKAITLLHPEHDTLQMSCSGADISFLNIAAR